MVLPRSGEGVEELPSGGKPLLLSRRCEPLVVAAMRRTAIVTGSESGIGRATALALARAGLDIGVTWHRERKAGEQTAAAVEAEGRRAVLHELDVTSGAGEVTTALTDALGGIDVLVNCAGIYESGPSADFSVDAFRRVLDVNVVGAYETSRAAAQVMVAQGRGGAIVNVTSVQGVAARPAAAAYAASKHALEGLTKSLALELAPHHIRVNSVAPGEVVTPMTNLDPRATRPNVPLGRPGLPEEIAGVIAHLALDASYTTGATFVVDGGLLAAALAPAPRPPLVARLRRRVRGR